MDPSLEKALARLPELIPAVGKAFDPLPLGDIRAIEKRMKRNLAPAHRDLLTTFGACRFEEDVFFEPELPFPASYSKSNRGILGIFLGRVNKEYPKATAISIQHRLKILGGDLPKDFLPVADTGSGDIYGTKSDGSVWLWIHDAWEGQELHGVAESFSNWLARFFE